MPRRPFQMAAEASRQSIGAAQIDCRFLAITAGLDVIGHALVLVQRAEASSLHGRDVDEAVLSAIFRLNEAIALVFVKEFYGSDSHVVPFQETVVAVRAIADGVVRQVVN